MAVLATLAIARGDAEAQKRGGILTVGIDTGPLGWDPRAPWAIHRGVRSGVQQHGLGPVSERQRLASAGVDRGAVEARRCVASLIACTAVARLLGVGPTRARTLLSRP
jgi:hypothetical protein